GDSGAAVRRPRRSPGGARPRPEIDPAAGTVSFDPLKAGLLVFVAGLVQVSILSAYAPLGGTADIVLVSLLALALLRGSLFGAAAGFSAGLLIDTANLGTLG